MIHVVKPRRYPHREGHAYTPTGFRRRVVHALMADGFSALEAQRLGELYFGTKHFRQHQDDSGVYRNLRKFRLHRLSRQHMKKDRKRKVFDLVLRSGMFYLFLDDEGSLQGFISPHACLTLGIIAPLDPCT